MTDSARARLLANPRLGSAALERLRESRVAVVGLGTLGGPIALHLSLLGVGLRLIDPGSVDESNLAAQLVPAKSVGRYKAEVRADQARELGASGPIEVRCSRVEALGAGELADLDLVVTAVDALRPRVQLDGRCQQLQIPMLDLAVDGTGQRLFARIGTYDHRAPDAACFSCRFDSRAREAIRREGLPSGCPSWRNAPA